MSTIFRFIQRAAQAASKKANTRSFSSAAGGAGHCMYILLLLGIKYLWVGCESFFVM
jgi:hypothetical protein